MNQSNSQNKAQIVYFSHGGGPLPILGDAGHRAMVVFMRQLPSKLKRPGAILVISAHWEEGVATLLGAQAPGMFYDYYGFPDEAYEITYPASGNPDLADRIAELLKRNHIATHIDLERGFDHGLFIPLKLMYPEADIPALQLSLLQGLDSSAHVSLGIALRGLLHEDILVIGSGFSFHNMRAFSWDWQKAPSARYCHPREEHLLPLHVCQGMANREAKVIFDDYILGKRGIAFMW
jgi:aromatic ring-opening dioxygenase catalytic subunit (LigB family)